MSDKELLELAAKAVGWTGWQSKHGYWNVKSPDGSEYICCHGWQKYDSTTGKKIPEPTFADAMQEVSWSPLADDGDAMRLAVKLKFEVTVGFDRTACEVADSIQNDYLEEIHNGDDCAATRRVIVRAAAEIGKAMP